MFKLSLTVLGSAVENRCQIQEPSVWLLHLSASIDSLTEMTIVAISVQYYNQEFPTTTQADQYQILQLEGTFSPLYLTFFLLFIRRGQSFSDNENVRNSENQGRLRRVSPFNLT